METWQIIAMSIGFNIMTILGCLLYCCDACKTKRELEEDVKYLKEALDYCEKLRKAGNKEDRRKKERRQ